MVAEQGGGEDLVGLLEARTDEVPGSRRVGDAVQQDERLAGTTAVGGRERRGHGRRPYRPPVVPKPTTRVLVTRFEEAIETVGADAVDPAVHRLEPDVARWCERLVASPVPSERALRAARAEAVRWGRCECRRARKQQIAQGDTTLADGTRSWSEMERLNAHATLDRVRRDFYEHGAACLAAAVRAQEAARTAADDALHGRSLVFQAAIALHDGDLRGAVALIADADPRAERARDPRLDVEIAAVKGQVSFFLGAYGEAVTQAERARALADQVGDVHLRIFARRCACVVFGNLGEDGWPEMLEGLLALSVEADRAWEVAISHNDLAHLRMDQGDLDAAEREIATAHAIASGLAPHNHFALSAILCTRGDIRLKAGRPEEALADARAGLAHVAGGGGYANPYLLAMTVVVEVQALLALGRLDEAESAGERAVDGLGERVPQARSLILGTVASALREADRPAEAYDVLRRSAAIEREAANELSALQRGLERAALETEAARREADALAAKNRELERVVTELHAAQDSLERRTADLEAAEALLRDQADRDWLTGLHNRRFLARAMEIHSRSGVRAAPFSLAILDLDRFKAVNDDYGHEAGDRVLRRLSAVLLGQVRERDTVARTGGEEFMLLMPATTADEAVACAERLCAAVRAEPWSRIAPGLALTASVGVATTDDAQEIDALVALADQLLYEAKRAGRDRVAVRATIG